MMKSLLGVLLIASVCVALNNRPIVGILTQPTSGGLRKYGSSYIAASYVKFIESGGGRAVPVLYPFRTSSLNPTLP